LVFLAIYIPEDKISEIKNKADIVDVISEVVVLKRTGKNYVGLCPFHSEKAPSFTVSPEKQIFYCFGCTTGGNVFSFLMKHNGITFPDATRILAKRFGIDLPTRKMSPEQKRRISERETLLAINRDALDYFRKELHQSSSGIRATAYLEKRGISREILDHFHLGYAPEGWDNLTNFFSKQNMPLDLVEKAGLIVSRKNKNGYYDRFRDRIIFPILDVSMQVLGFGGRVIDDSLPKYLNSPETSLYNKRRSLYGIHRAKNRCRELDTVYIVEGYLDLLSLHQYGMENSVATLGTALTSEQILLLKGFATRMILLYDSDEAGVKAALRSIGIFMQEEIDARIIALPKGYDPDSYIFEYGHEALINVAANAQSVVTFLIDSAVKKHGLSLEGKIRVISELIKPLTSIKDNLSRTLYIKELSERIHVDESAILEKVRETSQRHKSVAERAQWQRNRVASGSHNDHFLETKQKRPFKSKWGKLEQQIIAMMLQFPEIVSEIEKRNILNLFDDNKLKAIGELLLKRRDRHELKASDMMSLIEDKDQRNLIASLTMRDDVWNYKSCLSVLDRYESKRKKNKQMLLEQILEAERNNDMELLEKLLSEKQKMAVSNEKKKTTLLRQSNS
jgi:DNA primase